MATIALCVICKNERTNLPRLLDSVQGCFDEIHITDTGSTDGTLEYLLSMHSLGNLSLHHFTWVDDFAAARNASFQPATADYVMWLDCDDVLGNPAAFKQWKAELLPTANYWLATYHYSQDAQGNPACSFMRERVFLRSMDYKWRYFVHEGVPPIPHKSKVAYATSWAVRHLRSEEDIKVDRNRNLSIFEKKAEKLDARMQYYYGKELFEAGKPMEACDKLITAAASQEMELHDRILAIQYACMASQQCNQFEKAIKLAYTGLQLAPNRAEFYIMVGDAYLRLNQFENAIPSFIAASKCINVAKNNAVFQQPIFTCADSYEHYPRNQLARIYFQRGQINEAKKYLEEAMVLGPHAETGALYAEMLKVSAVVEVKAPGVLPQVDEYVISCPQIAMYQWDEEVLRNRGIGGSETAAVRLARLLHRKTGKVVRVFNDRPNTMDCGGVIYGTHAEARKYFSEVQPKAHIAWRHCVRLTSAPTFLWCHDLATPGMEHLLGFDKILALSEFHKQYMMHVFRIPEEKVILSRNGIDLDRFKDRDFSHKNSNKVVFSSSPDRGIERAIAVVAKAREISGRDLELHCFYGFDNMEKLGLTAEVARLRAVVEANPFVRMHGNVQQDALVGHIADAKAWLYPTDFLETFCITALEMVACRVRPVVRKWGALPHTLKDLPATVVDLDCDSEEQVKAWAGHLVEALEINQPMVDMDRFTWESVADQWLEWLPR